MYRAGNEGTLGGGVTAGGGATGGVGAGGGAVTQPTASTARTGGSARRSSRQTDSEGRDAMAWIILEVLLALVIAVTIVVWTTAPGRRKSRREPTDDARPDRKP